MFSLLKWHLFIVFLVSFCSVGLQATEELQKAALIEKLKSTIESSESDKLTALYDWEGVSKKQKEKIKLLWAINFAHDIQGGKPILECVKWEEFDPSPDSELKVISSSRFLGKFVVTGKSLLKNQKDYPFEWHLSAGVDNKENWCLIVTNLDLGRIQDASPF